MRRAHRHRFKGCLSRADADPASAARSGRAATAAARCGPARTNTHLEPLLEAHPGPSGSRRRSHMADLNTSPTEMIVRRSKPSGTCAQHGSDRRRRAVAPRGDLWPLIPTIGGQAFAGEFNGGPGNTTANGGPRQDYAVAKLESRSPVGLFDWGASGRAAQNWTQLSCPTRD